MIYTTMWAYPWDVIDEGPDRVVGILKEEVQDTVATMADPSILVAGLIAHCPIDSAELMKDILLAAHEGGARRFSYYNYGIIPERSLKWIGDAIAAVRALDAEN